MQLILHLVRGIVKKIIIQQTYRWIGPHIQFADNEVGLRRGNSFLPAEEEEEAPSVCQRRMRPKMTLSFGLDPSGPQKSLMFATNSPFDLNDCTEIQPHVPLDRQE